MLKARVTFRVMKLGRYVTVDDGGNCVTESSHKDKKIRRTPHNESLGRLCFNEFRNDDIHFTVSMTHFLAKAKPAPEVACFRFDILMDEKTCSAPHANSALVQQYDPRSVSFAHLLQLLNPLLNTLIGCWGFSSRSFPN